MFSSWIWQALDGTLTISGGPFKSWPARNPALPCHLPFILAEKDRFMGCPLCRHVFSRIHCKHNCCPTFKFSVSPQSGPWADSMVENMRACCGCCWWREDGYEICSCHANFNVYVDPAAPPWPLFPTSRACSSLLLPLGWQCSLALIDRWWPACVLLHCRCESNLFTLWMAGTKPKMN